MKNHLNTVNMKISMSSRCRVWTKPDADSTCALALNTVETLLFALYSPVQLTVSRASSQKTALLL